MAYKSGETMRLEEVRELGINPTAILDIGAHTGQFYSWAKRVWQNSVIWMVEANPLQGSQLLGYATTCTGEYYEVTKIR